MPTRTLCCIWLVFVSDSTHFSWNSHVRIIKNQQTHNRNTTNIMPRYLWKYFHGCWPLFWLSPQSADRFPDWLSRRPKPNNNKPQNERSQPSRHDASSKSRRQSAAANMRGYSIRWTGFYAVRTNIRSKRRLHYVRGDCPTMTNTHAHIMSLCQYTHTYLCGHCMGRTQYCDTLRTYDTCVCVCVCVRRCMRKDNISEGCCMNSFKSPVPIAKRMLRISSVEFYW